MQPVPRPIELGPAAPLQWPEPSADPNALAPGVVTVLPVKRSAHIGSMFEGYAPKRRAGRPRKYLVSPMGNMGLAKLFGGKPVRKERKRHEGLPVPRKRKAKKSPLARLIASLN